MFIFNNVIIHKNTFLHAALVSYLDIQEFTAKIMQKQKGIFMKKYIYILMAVFVLLLTVTACAGRFKSNLENGKDALNADRTDEAIGYFNKCISIDEKNPEGYFWMALVYKKKLRYDQFDVYMSKAFLNGKDAYKQKIADAYYAFAKELEKAERLENMYECFNKILTYMPEYSISDDYALLMGNKYYEKLFDYKRALAFYLIVDNNKDISPQVEQEVKYRIARCYNVMQEYTNALMAYNKLLEKYPNHTRKDEIENEIGRMNYQLAETAYAKKDYDEAIARCMSVFEVGKPALLLDNVRKIAGDSYAVKGETEDALTMFEAIVRNDPYRKRALTLYAMKQIEKLGGR